MTRYEKQVLSRLYNRWLVAQLIRRISDNPEAQQEEHLRWRRVREYARKHGIQPDAEAWRMGPKTWRTWAVAINTYLGRPPLNVEELIS